MPYAVHVVSGVVEQVLVTGDVPEGWIESDVNVAIGSTYSGGVFTPPVVAPPTSAEIEAEVQAAVDELTAEGNIRDRAIVMLVADIGAEAFNVSTTEARQLARDRLLAHYRTLKGI